MTRRIEVAGGYVLAVDVPRSPLDLHMVTAYKEGRYYRRGEKAALPMTEPEIREAYARIAVDRRSLDERLDELTRPELTARAQMDDSFIVAPWFSTRNLLDPKVLGNLGAGIYEGLSGVSGAHFFMDLQLEADGYRLSYPGSEPRATAKFYLAILRNGVIHASDHSMLECASDQRDAMIFRTFVAFFRIAKYLIAAQYAYKKVNYWGEVRVLYIIRPTVRLYIDPESRMGVQWIEPREYRFGPIDISLRQTEKRLGIAVLKPLFDEVFLTRGVMECPFFDENGHLREYYKEQMPGKVADAIG